MIHKEFWGILFLIFVGWIFVPGQPTTRIEHACRPVAWGGNLVTSLTSLAAPAQQASVQRWFDKFEYGCQYTAWRLIYQDEYNQHAAESASGASAPAKETGAKETGEKEGRGVPAPPVRKEPAR